METRQGGVFDLGFLPLSGLRLLYKVPCLPQREGTHFHRLVTAACS